jgi:hypothetical protein
LIHNVLHKEINKQRWDQLIDRCVNRMPCAYSWWLDAVCPGWDALVRDDYAAVMPLTRNRRLGIDYLYQPYFTQQLGVFSPESPGSEEINLFLDAIPSSCRFVDIQLNTGNDPTNRNFKYTSRKNCILDLSPSHIKLSAGYHRNCRRNILKAVHAGLSVKPGPDPSVFTRFIRRNLDRKLKNRGMNFYPTLREITRTTIQNGTGEILGVYNPGGELVAAGWFVTAAGWYTFLVCASAPSGKENQAMFLLVDHAIRGKAGTSLFFDFSGSNIPGIAYFNAGFGATEQLYPAVKRNLLPWPLRLFKK